MITDIARCARCGQEHKSLQFKELAGEATEGNFWGVCPTTRQPIFLEASEAEEKAEKALPDTIPNLAIPVGLILLGFIALFALLYIPVGSERGRSVNVEITKSTVSGGVIILREPKEINQK